MYKILLTVSNISNIATNFHGIFVTFAAVAFPAAFYEMN